MSTFIAALRVNSRGVTEEEMASMMAAGGNSKSVDEEDDTEGEYSSDDGDDTFVIEGEDATVPGSPRKSERLQQEFASDFPWQNGEQSSRSEAAATPPSAEQRSCPLCWEVQPYLQNTNKQDTAMEDAIQDFRKIIYDYEQMMCGRQDDETTFRGMLELRRFYVERLMDMSGVRYQEWTMELLSTHYNPTNGHHFDIVRDLTAEAADLRHVKKLTLQHGMFIPNPSGEGAIFNLRAVDVISRVSRQYVAVVTQKQAELRKRGTESGPEYRLLSNAVNDLTNKKQRVESADPAGDAVVDMYKIGQL